jgi:hypothetical protein
MIGLILGAAVAGGIGNAILAMFTERNIFKFALLGFLTGPFGSFVTLFMVMNADGFFARPDVGDPHVRGPRVLGNPGPPVATDRRSCRAHPAAPPSPRPDSSRDVATATSTFFLNENKNDTRIKN